MQLLISLFLLNFARKMPQSYEQIKQSCLRSGRLYEDPDFEAIDDNVFTSRRPPRPFVWRRPTVSLCSFSASLVCVERSIFHLVQVNLYCFTELCSVLALLRLSIISHESEYTNASVFKCVFDVCALKPILIINVVVECIVDLWFTSTR